MNEHPGDTGCAKGSSHEASSIELAWAYTLESLRQAVADGSLRARPGYQPWPWKVARGSNRTIVYGRNPREQISSRGLNADKLARENICANIACDSGAWAPKE
jgi:hypothetical protein